MKYDKAYCVELLQCLTIYQVRDLHFDEDENFDANNATFKCPDFECRQCESSTLTTFNATSKKYIKTPHFKDKPTTKHRDNCPYNSEFVNQDYQLPSNVHLENYKETNFPSEFLLKREKYSRNSQISASGQSDMKQETKFLSNNQHLLDENRGVAPNKTSILEHLVECYLSHQGNPALLRQMRLKIGSLTLPYSRFFKRIQYFYEAQDLKNLIYWGRIKQAKKYGQTYIITYEKLAYDPSNESPLSISIYINNDVIKKYRKRSLFQEQMEELTKKCDNILCFFIGAYPIKRTVDTNLQKVFEVYGIDIENLDHIYFCSDRTQAAK